MATKKIFLFTRNIVIILLTFHYSLLTFHCFSQGIAINTTGDSAVNSAMLDISGTNKGVVINRMTTTQRDLINSPIEGLTIYNLDCHNFNYYNGSVWIPLNSIGGSAPATPDSITGSANVCNGQTGVSYSVSSVTGANSYTWVVPSGSIVTSGQGSSGITVTFGTNSGIICVTANNSCGTSSPACLSITNNPIPAIAGTITGTNTVCQGQNNVSFSIPVISNATGYTWSLPSGASIASGSNTNSITVDFSVNASSGNITVYGNNSICNGTASSAFPITVNPLPATPGSISGNTPVCANAAGINYSISAVSGATSYIWTKPSGSTIESGQGNTGITVNFGTSSGNITVAAVNSCGTSSTNSLSVSVSAFPTTADAGSDQNLNSGISSTTLAGNTPTTGIGEWTKISGTATITTPGSPNSTLTGISSNIVLRWTISNTPCTASYDDVNIFFNACASDDAYTVLKIHADGSNGSTSFSDASPSSHSISTNGNAQVSTTQAKYNQSAALDGTGDYLSVSDGSDFQFGTGNFTIDFWLFFNAITESENGLVGKYTAGSPGGAYTFEYIGGASNSFRGYYSSSTTLFVIPVSSDLISLNQWYHIAFVRDAINNIQVYVNGVSQGSSTLNNTTVNGNSTPLTIGHYYAAPSGGVNGTNGYIDELRISKGVARWTSNFTPPSSPYCD
ncbi:MAG: LamG domain-containing protein [Bacteroidetes bacterium]|nr:LamG domain-containing protein [Bacteroidota bacterium]